MTLRNSRHAGLAFFCAWLLSVGCGSPPRTEPRAPQVGWRPIISFSGRGSTQSESFNIESTQWRIKWEAKGARPAGGGLFKIMVHSAVSGRPLMEAVRQRGNGSGIAYVAEDPRLYHLVIESDADWSIAVEEAVVGQSQPPR
jgi:hypothetical protein